MKRCLILAEGQTEERFIKDVLAPHLAAFSIFPTAVILTTKVVKNGTNFKGGVSSYQKLKADLIKLLRDTDAHVTSFIDYYGLPEDCPGMNDRPIASALERVQHVERSLLMDLNHPKNFIPFLVLHEFEALLFTDTATTASASLAGDMAQSLADSAQGLQPEAINERPETAPSKRILKVLPHFRKTLHGPTAAKRIGLDKIRGSCPHFDSWLTKLENLA